jgi:hypothetical protein
MARAAFTDTGKKFERIEESMTNADQPIEHSKSVALRVAVIRHLISRGIKAELGGCGFIEIGDAAFLHEANAGFHRCGPKGSMKLDQIPVTETNVEKIANSLMEHLNK